MTTHPDLQPESPHKPVLYQQIIHALRPTSEGRYVDCTVGAGGHAAGILAAASPDGRLLGLDRDPHALDAARNRLLEFGDRVHLVHASYVTLSDQLEGLEWTSVQGILFDLGMSSIQVDQPDRGFSFRNTGPLDMRFDPTDQITVTNAQG